MKCSFYSNPSYSPLKLKEEEEGWKKLRTFLKHLWCVKNWMKWKYHNRDSWEKDFNFKKNCLVARNKLILFRSFPLKNQMPLFHSNYSLVISTITKYFRRLQDVISDLQRFFKFQCSLSKWIMRCYLVLIVVLTFFFSYSYFCLTSWILLRWK